MEKSEKPNSNKQNVKLEYQIDKVNLHDFGYEKSGNAKGDPEIYASYLERIINGDLVDENYKGISEEEKSEKRNRKKELEAKLSEFESGNAVIEKEIKEKEKKAESRREELLNMREHRAQEPEELKRETFSPMKFWINLFILVMLTVYLFFFYVSAAYKALYVNMEEIANNIAQGLGGGSIMPGPYELAEALRYNYLLFLVPFVFYAFGWAFHILLDMKQRIKIVFLALLILVTFTVDFLIAFIIHGNTETAKELMGLSTVKWSQSSTFYIILFLGFLVYIIWSILLDSLLREWAKREITQNLKKIIKHLRRDIKTLQNKLIDTTNIKNDIHNLQMDIDTVMTGNLKGYIDQFSNGWISYLTPDNLKEVKGKCLNIKKDIEEKHNIRPGIVRVIKRKG